MTDDQKLEKLLAYAKFVLEGNREKGRRCRDYAFSGTKAKVDFAEFILSIIYEKKISERRKFLDD